MTGNNKIWRASLAGLASVAMLATMGVSAANAATDPVNEDSTQFRVALYTKDQPWNTNLVDSQYAYGDTYTPPESESANDPYAGADGKVLTGWSYDLAGKNVASSTGIAVKGDTKLYAQYAEAYTVTFKVNGVEKKIDVKKGEAITADAYKTVFATEPTEPGKVFVGWTYTDSSTKQDLYTDQAITADTTLYPYFQTADEFGGLPAYQQNVSKVVFHKNNTDASADVERFTLANRPFPAFRVPDISGVDEWQAPLGTKYDFTKNVPNKDENDAADLTIYGTSFADSAEKAWTITYDFGTVKAHNGYADQTVNPTNDGEQGDKNGNGKYSVQVSGDVTAAQPSDPVAKGALFTGWYTKDGKTAIDFSKAVKDLPGANQSKRTVTVYAGWDTKNVVPVVFYYGYQNEDGGVWGYPVNQSEANGRVASFTGKALNYQTKGTSIVAPTGLEDYYRTAADKDKANDSYTSSKVTGWYAITDKTPVTSVPADGNGVSVYAKWSASAALKLNANGGFFKNGTNYAYATKADGQSWKDVVETPTRDGYNFAGWAEAAGYGFVNLAAGKYYDASGAHDLEDGTELVAVWVPASVQSVKALHDRFGLSGWNKDADVKTVVDAGYTEASAKAYVDAWYDLQDEYAAAFFDNTTTQAQIDAYNTLLPKYEAAEALLKKSDVPVEPAPAEKVAVYRAYNPALPQVAQHLYTTNVEEYNARVANDGWIGEGIVFYTTSDKNATPVYRLYNQYTSEHFLTSDKAEYEDLYQNKGWTNEGVAWYAPSDGDSDLFRLQNPVSFEHLYTINPAEKDNLTANAGWKFEGAAYKVYAK